MTDKQAINDSVAHWKRMIWWVIEICILNPLFLFKRPNDEEMENIILESWYADFCPLCKKYFIKNHSEECNRCPLKIKYGECDNPKNKNRWIKVNKAKTWLTWLIHAFGMLRQLKSL